jgi:hypothetical protein
VRAELDFDLGEMPLDGRDAQYIAWTRWREQQLEALIGEVAARVRKVRGAIPILGATPAGWRPEPIERVGLMDWARWVREGLLDVAAPQWLGALGSTTVEERRATLLADFEAIGPTGRLAPVLPLSDLHAEGTPMLTAIRALPISGHVWDAEPAPPSERDWAAMRRVHGEVSALVPEIDPLDSVRAVIQETARLAPPGAPLATFLDDLLAVLQTGFGQFSDAQMGDLLEDLEKFESQARRGEIGEVDPLRAARNLNWIQRQLVFLRGRQLFHRGY